MSGKDERKVPEIPRCPTCNGKHDVILKYRDGNVAGWIVPDDDIERFGVPVIISNLFLSDCVPTLSYCLACARMRYQSVGEEFGVRAIKFFNEQIRTGNYITWVRYSELIRREREG